MTSAVASAARAGRGRSRPPAPAVRAPARPAASPASSISAATSLLAASFADQGALPERDEAAPDQDSLLDFPVVARRAAGEAAPVGRSGVPIHWIASPGAAMRGSLLDLQRLAGNAAVASALRPAPMGAERGGAGVSLAAAPGVEGAAALQRINIPGIGEVDISGYLSRATSILSSAEETGDKSKSDARKGADVASDEATGKVDAGTADLEAEKTAAQAAGDAEFSETRGAADADAAAGMERAAGEKAKGDETAEKVNAVEPAVEGMVDPLAETAGSPTGAAGPVALEEAAGHAAGPGAPAAGGAAHAPSNEPAVSHGPGPPAPGPGPAPATPEQAGPSPAGPGQVSGTPAPSCALAEAVKTVKGYRDKAAEFARGVAGKVAEIEIPFLGETVGSLATKAKKAARAVGAELGKVKDAVVAKARQAATKIKNAVAAATKVAKKALDAAAKGIKRAVTQVKDMVVNGWNAAKSAVSTALTNLKTRAAAAVRGAISTVQGWIGSIPDWVLDHLGGIGRRLRAFVAMKDPLGEAADYLAEKRRQAHAALDRAKQAAIGVARGVADYGVRKAAELYQGARSKASAVADAARTAAPYVLAVVAPGVVVVAGAAQAAADTWGDDIRAGAEAVKKKLKGEACEALSDTIGPCIDMYLPKPENNDKGFARLSGQADITVPLHEVGVPCNVKMGRSASVGVERTSSGYNVAVDGEALVFANLAAGKEGAKEELKVELPTGGMATAWERLGGGAAPPVPATGPAAPAPGGTPGAGAPAPGAPAPAPGAPAPGPQGGGGAEASGEVEGGLKGSASLKFSFPTGSNTCDGAGGVAALLGALGVSAALPAPLDVIARSGVVGSWEGNLVSNTVTMAVAGGGQFELSKEGLGALKGAGQAEAYVTTGVERANETDASSLRPTLKVGAGLRGELAAELAVPKLGLARGAVSGAGKLEATLVYDKVSDRVILQSVAGEAEVGLAVGGINPAVVAGLAPPFGPAAAAKIASLGLAHSNGSIKAKVAGKADNLQKYIDAAGTYLSRDPSSVSAAGLVSAVVAAYDEKDFSASVTVTATVSDRIGVEGKVEEIGGEGAKAGVSAKASLEVGREYQLYP